MATQRACDFCKFHKPGIRRYSLSAQIPSAERRADPRRPHVYVKRGAGGLDICPDCWEIQAKPKMNGSQFNPRTAPFPKYG